MYPIHHKYLRYLANNLDILHLNDYERVLFEPEWINSKGDPNSLCDLIVINSQIAVPVELKKSQLKKSKAIKQLERGLEFITSELKLESLDYGIFVTYDSSQSLNLNPYEVERINF